jgi:hypothetical protein
LAGYFVLGLSAGEKPEVKPTTVVVDGVGNPITIKVVPPASAGTKDKAASSSAGGETGKAVGAAK